MSGVTYLQHQQRGNGLSLGRLERRPAAPEDSQRQIYQCGQCEHARREQHPALEPEIVVASVVLFAQLCGQHTR